jgi:hypothetical protein
MWRLRGHARLAMDRHEIRNDPLDERIGGVERRVHHVVVVVAAAEVYSERSSASLSR